MKAKLLFVFFVLLEMLGVVRHTSAQYLDVQPSPVVESTVGWNTSASFCQIMPGSSSAKIALISGSVGFAAGAFGTIGLACNISGGANGVRPGDVD